MDLGAALEAARQRQEQAGQAVAAAQEAGDSLSKSLGESIQELTRQAKADMAGLELRLQADGVDHRAAAANQGSPKDLDIAFETARLEAVSRVLGQDGFVTGLTLALKRPFVAGCRPSAPLCRAAILGEAGTGRHSALEVLIASLGRQGVLKSPKTAALDLGAYSAAGSEQLFFQDLYAALKGGAAALVFEGVEKCCPAVLALVSGLFQEGSVPLPGRYAEQKGMLVDIRQRLGARGGILPLRGGEIPVPPHQPEPGAAGRDFRRAFFGRPGRHLRDSALLPGGLWGSWRTAACGTCARSPRSSWASPRLRSPGGRGPLPGLYPGGGGRLLKGGGGAAVQGPQ